MARRTKVGSVKPTSPHDIAPSSGESQAAGLFTGGIRQLPDPTPDNLEAIPDPPPHAVLALSDLKFRDRVIDAWKNASLLFHLIGMRIRYYDCLSTYIYFRSHRETNWTHAIRLAIRQNIAYECFFDSYIELALKSLKSLDANVPMIRGRTVESLLRLFPSFPDLVEFKRWGEELESAWKLEPPKPGEIWRYQHVKLAKAARQSMPTLGQLSFQLFKYMQSLRTCPTDAFGTSRPSATNRAEDSHVDKSPEASEVMWLTVTKAAKVADTHRGTISVEVSKGRLKSNGKKGRDRRIDAIDLIRWKQERSKRLEPESEEEIKRLLRKAGMKDD
jgi:hypothetical protein